MRGLRTIMLFVPIFLALLFDITHYSLHHEVQPVTLQKQNAQKETSNSYTGEKQIPPAVSLNKQAPTTNANAEHSDNADYPTLYPTYLLATIIGVGVALFGLRYLIRSANAARDAAVAAGKNAEALINAERAWVFADLWLAGGRDFVIDADNNTTSICFIVTCKNVGKAPAWITSIWAKFILLEFGKPIPPPDFTNAELIHVEPKPMAPNPKDIFKTNSQWLQAEGVYRGRASGEYFPMVYGIVYYRDPFGEDRFTTFGYKIIPETQARLERIFIDAYNQTK